jgi:hypothetical protein
MSKITSFALAGMLALAVAAVQARADGLAADKTNKPAATEKLAKVVAPLTDDSLKEMLENMGYDVKVEKQEKTSVYTVKIDQGTWTYFINVALSNDKDQLWITSAVTDVPADGKVPAEMLLRLLEENDHIGPGAVFYDKKFKKIKVGMALLNHGGVTPAVLHTYLGDYLKDLAAVQKLCDFPKGDDKAEVKKVEEKTEAKK